MLRTLLASLPIPEHARVDQSGVPSRTFRAARARIYADRWVVDRYLPQLSVVGQERLCFAIAEPFVEHAPEVRVTWAEDPASLLVWSGAQTIFGVFRSSASAQGTGGAAATQDPARMHRTYTLEASPDRGEVPIYLDFEGSVRTLLGASGTVGYPHPWPSPRSGSSDEPSEIPPHVRAAAAEMVRRPFVLDPEGWDSSALAPFFLPRSQQRALASGAVMRRIFLHPGALPAFEGRRLDRLIFVRGELLPGRLAEHLLVRLLEQCQVSPFLFATDRRNVLLGAVGFSPAPEATSVRASVSGVLELFLRGIEVFREPVDTLVPLVNHRYDRLLR